MSGSAVALLAACASGRARVRRTTPLTATQTSSSPTTSPPATVDDTASTVPSPSPVVTGPAIYVGRGSALSVGVALTFHTAGDPAIVEDILDQARRLDARLTFFLVGDWAAAHPGVVEQVLAAGHDLGNHTWSHIDLAALDASEMYDEIQRCATVLRAQTGSIGKWFRPSQIDVPTAAILEQAGRVGYTTSVGYDVDPLDYTNPGALVVEQRVRASLHPGAIVSLHTLYPGTAAAFGPIVTAIRAQGLEPVATTAVLGH